MLQFAAALLVPCTWRLEDQKHRRFSIEMTSGVFSIRLDGFLSVNLRQLHSTGLRL